MPDFRGVAGGAALAVSAGLLFTASPVQAASIIDLPQPAGNTIQVSTGPGAFAPQFSVWPIPNNETITTSGNNATGKGNNTSGQAFLFGTGAGNVVQFATGGTIVAPQVAVGTSNNLTIHGSGNTAVGDGNHSSTTGAVSKGVLIDGNGNVFQVAIGQGNVFAPQIAVGGDNNATIDSQGNLVKGVGNNSDTTSSGGFTFLDGNGNVYQIEILSNNVVAPQISIGGNNNLVVNDQGNDVSGAGNGSSTTATGGDQQGVAGVFTVTTTHVGNGNVTQVAILSNNVIAPQIAIGGTNHSTITAGANDATGDGNGSDTTADSVNPPANPVLTALHIPGQNQLGNGNTVQHASGSGAISNPQLSIPKISAPVKVNPLVFKPTTLAGTNKPSSTSTTTTGSNPGGGIKSVVNSIKSAFAPKKPAAKPAG